MSVNHRYAYDSKKVEKFGELFKTIDFDTNENFASLDFEKRSKSAICGTFHIGGRTFNVTTHELKQIITTAEAGLEVLKKKYKRNMLA